MASECTIPRKRPRASVDETESELDTESPNSSGSGESGGSTEHKLPYEINKWSEENIQGLGIKVAYDETITPIDLLGMFPLEYPLGKDLTKYFLWKNISIIEAFLKKDCLFHDFLDGGIHDMPRKTVNALRKRDLYTQKQHASDELKLWFQRFEVLGMQFGEMLYSMVLKRDLGKCTITGKTSEAQLTEYDFQFLFEAFASMLGLQTYHRAEPLMRSSTLQLSQATISGKADILYCWDIAPDEEGSIEELMRVVAVCEIKKHCSSNIEKDCGHGRVTRGSDAIVSSTSSATLPPHISHNLLGQHGGELLLHYKQSIKRNVIFGMIIQETKVTFTALKMNEKQYNGILTAKHEEIRPQLVLTKPLDFLKKHEREHLIRPLLELAMMQELNFSERNVWTSM